MNKLVKLYNQITTTYKQKIFGKFLQVVNNYKFLSFSKDIYCVLYDDSVSIINLLCWGNLKKYIFKDISISILNYSSYTKNNLSFLLKENVNYTKSSKKNYSFNSIKNITSNNQNKSILCSIQDTFDDEITYILYELFYNGQLSSLLPIEKKNNIYIIRPSFIIRNRDVLSIANRFNLKENYFSSISFTDIENKKLSYIKDLINTLKKNNIQSEMNIYNATNNVILDKILSYIKNNKHYNFDDIFNKFTNQI